MTILARPELLSLLIVPVAAVLLIYLKRRSTRGGLRPVARDGALRLAGILFLLLAISGLARMGRDDAAHVAYLFDRSESVSPRAAEAGAAYIRDAARTAGPRDTSALISFAEESAVETAPTTRLDAVAFHADLPRGETDIAGAMYSAIGLLPASGTRRIVLLSDGYATRGDAVRAARVARSDGITVDVVPLAAGSSGTEAFVRAVHVPRTLAAGEAHEIEVVVHATDAMPATIALLQDGTYMGQEKVNLEPGDNVFRYQNIIREPGIHTYDALLSPAADSVAGNNEYSVATTVEGAPRVLLVHAANAQNALGRALETQGIMVTYALPDEVPATVEGLSAFAAIIFHDVPAFDFSLQRMERIESYVKDTGGGFLMTGGPSSFGAGGYYQTPVERLLPVDMDVTSTVNVPSLALLFVVDKSGSMGEQRSMSPDKLDLVKQAVLASVDIMNPYYRVGVLAFDADYEWASPLVEAGKREQIADSLLRLSPGGGTILYPALEAGYHALASTEASVKHMVVLSDGLTQEADFRALVEKIAAGHISVSTVAVGTDSDRELLAQIADWGGGRSYFTTEAGTIPRIFTAETTIVSRNLIMEKSFFPQERATSQITDGLEHSVWPALRGLVLTYQKPGAKEVLAGPGGNPLLATWQYGLGRSAAFTSDLESRWSLPLLQWPSYPRLVAQLVRWIMRPAGEKNNSLAVTEEDGSQTLRLDARRPDGSFRNFMKPHVRITAPNAAVRDVTLEQTAPGEYSAPAQLREQGTYVLTVYDGADPPGMTPWNVVHTVSYGRELLYTGINSTALTDIASAGGGRVVSGEAEAASTANFYRHVRSAAGTFTELWNWLLPMVLLLLLIEVALHQLFPAERHTEPAAGRQDQSEAAKAAEVSYVEARKQVVDSYERERRTRRDLRQWYQERGTPKGPRR